MSLDQASLSYNTAEYLLEKTFPHTKNTKIFLSVLQHLSEALENVAKCTTTKNFSAINALNTEISEILLLQKKCTTEFQRQENLVLCKDDYELKVLSKELLQHYLEKTGEFLEKVNSSVTGNERNK